MKMRTMEMTVGALMIAGIASLLMLALQVSGFDTFFPEERGYKVRAEFTNIGGLKPRAKVAIAGVVVGRVKNFELDPNTFNATVVLMLDPNRVSNLPADTRASIMTSGLLGDNYIALTPGFNETEFLKQGSMIPVENTDSAIAIEQLISKFLGNQAMESASQEKQVQKPLKGATHEKH